MEESRHSIGDTADWLAMGGSLFVCAVRCDRQD